jgi:hypothetical protein
MYVYDVLKITCFFFNRTLSLSLHTCDNDFEHYIAYIHTYIHRYRLCGLTLNFPSMSLIESITMFNSIKGKRISTE